MSNKRRIVFATLTIVWCYIIYSFSGATGEESQGTSMGIVKVFVDSFFPFVKDEQSINFLNFIIRKAAHMTEYAVLFLFGYNFTKTFNISKLKTYLYTFVFSVIYAAFDEFHQLFVGGRSGSIEDVGIDSLGVICMMMLIVFCEKIIKNIKEKRVKNV